MKDLIRGLMIVVFMLNMVYVHEQNSKAKAVKTEAVMNARYAKNKATRRALYKAMLERDINKADEVQPVVANY